MANIDIEDIAELSQYILDNYIEGSLYIDVSHTVCMYLQETYR